MKLCSGCKRQIADDDTSCPFCGSAAFVAAATAPVAPVTSAPAQSAPVSAPSAQQQVAVPQAPSMPVGALYLPASRLQRFANYVVDTICIYGLGFVIGIIAVLGHVQTLGFVVSLFCSLLFYTFFETVLGRTPGKYLTGTKVIMRDGSRPGFGTILLRSVIRFVPFEPLSILLFPNPIGWHDGWSHTMVVPASFTPEQAQQVRASNKPAGWTIIIAVIALAMIIVLGIFSAIVLTSLNTAREKSRDARRVADVKQIQLGLELYYDKNGSYPAALSDLNGADYLSAVPADPTTNQPYFYASCAGKSYHLATALEFQGAQLESDADAAPQCAEDPIDGKDAGGCVAGTGGFCFDMTDQLTGAPSGPQAI